MAPPAPELGTANSSGHDAVRRNSALDFLTELSADCMAHVAPGPLDAETTKVIDETAMSLFEVREAVERATKEHRSETGGSTHGPADDAQRAADVKSLSSQIERARLLQHMATRPAVVGGARRTEVVSSVLPMLRSPDSVRDVVCAAALVQDSATGVPRDAGSAGRTGSEGGDEVPRWALEVAAVVDGGGALPLDALARHIARIVDAARGAARAELSEAELSAINERLTPAAAPTPTTGRGAASRPSLGAGQALSDTDSDDAAAATAIRANARLRAVNLGQPRTLRDYTSGGEHEAHSPEVTGFTPLEAETIIQSFAALHVPPDVSEAAEGRISDAKRILFRVWTEWMRTAVAPDAIVPKGARLVTTPAFATNVVLNRNVINAPQNVTDVHKKLPATWNVTSRLVDVVTCNYEGGGTCYTAFVTDLNGLPLVVCRSPSASIQHAVRYLMDHVWPACGASKGVTTKLLGSAKLFGTDPRIFAPGPTTDAAQTKLLEKLHAPARRLRRQMEEFKIVSAAPPACKEVRDRSLEAIAVFLAAVRPAAPS